MDKIENGYYWVLEKDTGHKFVVECYNESFQIIGVAHRFKKSKNWEILSRIPEPESKAECETL